MEKVVCVKCASGHVAAFGVTVYFSYVGSLKRPQPTELEELVRNAKKELSKDEFWNGLLRDIQNNDQSERKKREVWLDKKSPASGTSGVED